MSGDISLYNLVDLSIGTPEIGVVNFNALHTLLHAILDHLKIQTVTIKWTREEECVGQTMTALPREQNRSGPGYQDLEDKLRRIETQIALVENLPSGTELLDRSSASATPVHDMWQLMQLRRHIQTNEDGVSKSLSLVQDLLLEIQELKESRDQLKEKVEELHTALEKMNSALLADRTTTLEECCHRVEQMEAATRSLRERVERCPSPEVLENLVTWEVLQSALLSERDNLHTELSAGAMGPVTDPPTPRDPVRPSSPSSPPTLTPQRPSPSNKVAAEDGIVPLRGVSAAERFPETLEALRVMGRLSNRHDDLEERMETLEAELARLDDLAKLASGAAGTPDPAEDVLEQMKHLRSQVEGLSSDGEKPGVLIEEKVTTPGKGKEERRESRVLRGRREQRERRETREGMPDWELAQGSQEVSTQISQLRNVVQKLEEDVREVRGREEAKQHLQDQLDNLRGVLEDMMGSSSSSLLCQSLQEREQGERDTQGERERDPQSESGTQGERDRESQRDSQREREKGRSDIQGPDKKWGSQKLKAFPGGRKLSSLSQPSEKLQEAVSTPQQDQCSDAESAVQNAIAQLQADCERLRDTTQHLMENHDERQTHLQKLYKSMKVLEEKKADKQLLETEIQIKADKCALESKVSHVQLDAATEQLSAMFHDLLSKVTGQEQDWHKVIDRLSSEMEGKLNRMELDSLKKQLEDRWKNIRRKLKSQPVPEQQDAAGITRQLVARFHCISCSRPVDMHTTGPERIPEMADYSYVTMSRRCGGRHTVTQPFRRSARFQHLTQFYQTEAQPVHAAQLKLQPGEMDILGLDGQIYKGRLNTKTPRTTDPHLPSLSPRESICKSSDGRVQRSQSQMSCTAPGPGSGAPTRPQSTKAVRSRNGSGGSGRAWPVSVLGSAADDLRSLAQSSGELQRYAPITELHVDLRPPDEEGPGTNL